MKKILYLVAILCIFHESPVFSMTLMKKLLCCCYPFGRVAPEERQRISPRRNRKQSFVSIESTADTDPADQNTNPIAKPFRNHKRPARLTIPSREQEEGSLTPQNSPIDNRATTPSRSLSDSEIECSKELFNYLKQRYSRVQEITRIGDTMSSAVNIVRDDNKRNLPYASTPSSHLPDRDFESLSKGDYFGLFSSTDNLDDFLETDLKKPSDEFPMIQLRKPQENLNEQDMRHRIRRLERGLEQIEMEEFARKEQLKQEYILQNAIREQLKAQTTCPEELKSETMSPCNEEKYQYNTLKRTNP